MKTLRPWLRPIAAAGLIYGWFGIINGDTEAMLFGFLVWCHGWHSADIAELRCKLLDVEIALEDAS